LLFWENGMRTVAFADRKKRIFAIADASTRHPPEQRAFSPGKE